MYSWKKVLDLINHAFVWVKEEVRVWLLAGGWQGIILLAWRALGYSALTFPLLSVRVCVCECVYVGERERVFIIDTFA